MDQQFRLDFQSKILVATSAIAYMSHQVCQVLADKRLFSGVTGGFIDESIQADEKVLTDVVAVLGDVMQILGDYMNDTDITSELDAKVTERAFKIIDGFDLVEDPDNKEVLDERIESKELEEFRIVMSTNEFRTVKGYRLTIEDIPCFIFHEDWGWNVSHLQTGMTLNEYTKPCTDAIDEAIARVNSASKGFLDQAATRMRERGLQIPVNE